MDFHNRKNGSSHLVQNFLQIKKLGRGSFKLLLKVISLLVIIQ